MSCLLCIRYIYIPQITADCANSECTHTGAVSETRFRGIFAAFFLQTGKNLSDLHNLRFKTLNF